MTNGVKRILESAFPRLYARLAVWKHRVRFAGKDGPQLFSSIFRKNFWQGPVSRSGGGSDLVQTQRIRAALPTLMRELGVRSVLDVPCGDFYWMKTVELGDVAYIGADIVEELISENMRTFGGGKRQFMVKDVTTSELPKVDLLLCRDCLVHLSFEDVEKALQNIASSGFSVGG